MQDGISFESLLKLAVTSPGRILSAYQLFHDYSAGNQMLAMFQCLERGLALGPINTYKGWQKLGRQVRKGEKAISLRMPVTCSKPTTNEDGESIVAGFVRFIFRANWFVISQTDGAAVSLPDVPSFDMARALSELDIQQVTFDALDGNAQGFARDRSIAVSPIAAMPAKTTFHVIGQVILGHTAENLFFSDSESTPRNIREVEAESVAMLCCAALDLPGIEYSRGYIQSWWGSSEQIPEKSAQKIFKATSQILTAGRIASTSQTNLFSEVSSA